MFFANVNSMEELKKRYRQLAFQYHPDRGGDEKAMKAINEEYAALSKKIAANSECGNNNSDAAFVDDGFREILYKLIVLDGLSIEICGSWIWISGETKKWRKELKEAGCFWASKKLMWYWRPESAKRRSTGMKDMEYIRNVYGSQIVTDAKKNKVVAK